MTITLKPSVFSHGGAEGDFNWMLKQPQWKDSLFIFNDNEAQSEEFLAQVAGSNIDPSSNACQAGGGNAVIRPYQCQTPPRAAGVPTGPGYETLTPHAQSQIDNATAWIGTLLGSGRYTEVIYSASSNDPTVLGHGIFRVGDDVLRYIPAQLQRIVDRANAR